MLKDGRLASGSEDNTVRIWNINNTEWECVRTILIKLSKYIFYNRCRVFTLCVLEDGRLAVGSYDTNVQIFDVETGVCDMALEGHDDNVNAMCMLMDGKLASGSCDKTIRIWDTFTGKLEMTLIAHNDSVRAMCVLGDGRLVSSSWDKTVCIYK